MSGIIIIGALLQASPALLAVVPAERMAAGELPQGTSVPSLVVSSVSDVPAHGIRGSARLTTERVQVTIRSRHPEQQIQLLKLVADACDGVTGAVAGFSGVDVVSAGKGPDFRDDAPVWLTSRDFRVTYRP